MKDNTILNIQHPEAIKAVMDDWEEQTQERIWAKMGMSKAKAKWIIETIPLNLPWYDVTRTYVRKQAELYLKKYETCEK